MPTPIPPRLAELRRQFGLRLRDVREGRGLSQERLGELAEVDRKTINRIENGMYSPRLDNVFQIADALDITVKELFDVPATPRNA
ncbi:helix-turn-helix transcriptional regulator [Streptosporangium roseum]|uniref:helix-turn-helix transcriptional regulator n=1 Tax=Streptosporangium roseum TaxID=2001 RepID=UPI0033276368